MDDVKEPPKTLGEARELVREMVKEVGGLAFSYELMERVRAFLADSQQ